MSRYRNADLDARRRRGGERVAVPESGALKRMLALLAIVMFLALAGRSAIAQEDGPSWREGAPERPELPPDMAKPEFDFAVDREALMGKDQFKIDREARIETEAMDPELGRVATWRERMISDRATDAAAEPQPEPQSEPAPPVEEPATLAAMTPPPSPIDETPEEPLKPRASAPTSGFRLSPSQPVQPEYPREAFMDRVEGWVDVEMIVEPDGSVSQVNIIDAEPRRVFDKSALRAAHRWEFEPPSASGIQSPQRGVYRFEFNFDG